MTAADREREKLHRPRQPYLVSDHTAVSGYQGSHRKSSAQGCCGLLWSLLPDPIHSCQQQASTIRVPVTHTSAPVQSLGPRSSPSFHAGENHACSRPSAALQQAAVCLRQQATTASPAAQSAASQHSTLVPLPPRRRAARCALAQLPSTVQGLTAIQANHQAAGDRGPQRAGCVSQAVASVQPWGLMPRRLLSVLLAEAPVQAAACVHLLAVALACRWLTCQARCTARPDSLP